MKRLFASLSAVFLFIISVNAQDSYTQAIRINPVRLATGTFQLEFEQELTENFTASFMGLGTYAVDNGLGGWYVNTLKRDFTTENIAYEPKIMSGLGLITQGRYYLYNSLDAPKGIYAGPHLMYRQLWITSTANVSNTTRSITDPLGIFAGGLIVGVQLPIVSKVVFDVWAGPVMRVSSYAAEEGVSHYNHWIAIDHTGITLNFGVSIGLIR